MTLCIAAHCTELPPDQPYIPLPCVICCFDTQVETNIAKAETGFKFSHLSEHWVALMAGTNHLARELLEIYMKRFAEAEPSGAQAEIIETLRLPPRELRRRHAEHLVQRNFAISYDDFLKNGAAWLGEDVHRQTLYEISAQFSALQLNVELILIGIVVHGLVLYKFSQGELIECDDFAAIGSGATIAEPVMYQRELARFDDISKVTYVAYEAKCLGQTAPGVGERTYLFRLSISPRGTISVDSPTDDNYASLKQQFRRYSPKSLKTLPRINYFSRRSVLPQI